MTSPDLFELTIKMNRLSSIGTFKDFNDEFSSTHSDDDIDLENSYGGQKYTLNFHTLEDRSHLGTIQFFKDPVHPPDEQIEDTKSSGLKPGRNMRACRSVSAQCKDIPDMISKRKHLLQRQREQKLQIEKEESSTQMATALVNGLLYHGFQLEAPDETPRMDYMNPFAPTFSNAKPIEETRLIADVHTELKRVQESES